MNKSALHVPVVGYLVPFDATKVWLTPDRRRGSPTVTARIAYDTESDEWTMVEQGTSNSVVLFVDQAIDEGTRFLRIKSIGNTGKFVHASVWN